MCATPPRLSARWPTARPRRRVAGRPRFHTSSSPLVIARSRRPSGAIVTLRTNGRAATTAFGCSGSRGCAIVQRSPAFGSKTSSAPFGASEPTSEPSVRTKRRSAAVRPASPRRSPSHPRSPRRRRDRPRARGDRRSTRASSTLRPRRASTRWSPFARPQPDLGPRTEHDVAVAADRERTARGCDVGGELGRGPRREIDPPDDAVRERRDDPAVRGREPRARATCAGPARRGRAGSSPRGGPEHELIVDERGLLEIVAEIDRVADRRDDPAVVRAVDDDRAMTTGHGHELRDADHRADVDGLVRVRDRSTARARRRAITSDHVAGHERRARSTGSSPSERGVDASRSHTSSLPSLAATTYEPCDRGLRSR